MTPSSFAFLVFLEGAAAGVAFGIRTRRFLPKSVLLACGCIVFGLVIVAPVGTALWHMAGTRLGTGEALLFAHMPFIALTFALLAAGVRGVVRRGRASAVR